MKEEIIERPAPEPTQEEIQAAIKEEVEKAKSESEKNSSNDNASSNGSSNSIQVDTAPLAENVSLSISETPGNIAFSDVDTAVSVGGEEVKVDAPKTVERLEKIANEAHERRKAEEAAWDDEDDDDMPLKIGQEVKLELADINDLNRSVKVNDVPQLEIETL